MEFITERDPEGNSWRTWIEKFEKRLIKGLFTEVYQGVEKPRGQCRALGLATKGT